jgi:hypothetical protein
MKLSLLLSTALLTINTYAQQPYATKSFNQPCAAVQSAAVSFIQHKGLGLLTDITCDHCFIGTTGHLRDPEDHAISTKTAIKLYTNAASDKTAPGTWAIHTDLEATARLSFRQIQSTCTASLLFLFSWYATEYRGIMRVDGVQASRPSNLHLETDYLEAIAKTIPPPPPPKPN